MKNLLTYVNPRKDFDKESKAAIKIQIDNSLALGWKKKDIILITNFPYEYNGVKSLMIGDDNYCTFCQTSTKINIIVELFKRGLIDENELYWYHDNDAYQLSVITEAELDLRKADMALADLGTKPKLDSGSIFFKSSAEDIFHRLKETVYKYQENEESYALTALYTNNLLWVTETDSDARARFIPANIPGTENFPERIKKIDISYNFGIDCLNQIYEMAGKPIKVAHFHFSSDLLLDSAMYGKNSINKPLLPERLIKIFHKHGVKGVFPKPMKNLMIYISPEKKFLGKDVSLVKQQIDNSLNLNWKKEDIVLVTNFPYEYQGVKSTVLDDSLFRDSCDQATKSNVIFQLLTQEVVKEAELWWYHDLDVLELQPIDSSQINLEDTTAGFKDDGSGKLDTKSFYFRKDSDKIFEWMRNRTCKLNTDEKEAFMSLTTTNYRNINLLYKKIKLNNFTAKS